MIICGRCVHLSPIMSASPKGTNRFALPAGTIVGGYKIIDVLGEGGFGITYLVEHLTMKRQAAMKELLPIDLAIRTSNSRVEARYGDADKDFAWAKERFIEEARKVALCLHRNIVEVFDYFEANGTAYMLTSYVDGQTLEAWARHLGRPPSEDEVRDLLDPLLDGLEVVHRNGLLHRDIKPENIYRCHDGRPVLLDFGSAREIATSRSRPVTAILTPGYAPIEQYSSDDPDAIGRWSDLYALAATFTRVMTGQKPPEASRRIKADPHVPLTEQCKGRYSAGLCMALDKAFAVFEQDRPQSVTEFRRMLPDRIIAEPAPAPAPPPPPSARAVPQALSSPPPVALIIGGLFALLLLGGALIWLFVSASTQPAARPTPPQFSYTTPTPIVVPPAAPAPPASLVFTNPIWPTSALVTVNGQRTTVERDSAGRSTVSLAGFQRFPVKVRFAPPPGYRGSPVELDDPVESVRGERIAFDRLTATIAVRGNANYTRAQLTFLGSLPDESIDATGQGLTPMRSEPFTSANGYEVRMEVPTGRYRVHLISDQSNVADRVALTEWAATAAGGVVASPAIPAWSGTLECRFNYESARITRVLTLPGNLAANGTVADTSVNTRDNSRTAEESAELRSLRLSSEGVLTGVVAWKAKYPSNPQAFDEDVTLTRQSDGSVRFEFKDGRSGGNRFHVQGNAR